MNSRTRAARWRTETLVATFLGVILPWSGLGQNPADVPEFVFPSDPTYVVLRVTSTHARNHTTRTLFADGRIEEVRETMSVDYTDNRLVHRQRRQTFEANYGFDEMMALLDGMARSRVLELDSKVLDEKIMARTGSSKLAGLSSERTSLTIEIQLDRYSYHGVRRAPFHHSFTTAHVAAVADAFPDIPELGGLDRLIAELNRIKKRPELRLIGNVYRTNP